MAEELKPFNLFNFKDYAVNSLKIRDKNSSIIPFKFNQAQIKLDNLIESLIKKKIPIRIVILKARQMGFSTYTEGRLLHKTITTPNFKTGIITHKDEATTNLFNMSKRYYDNLPDILKPTIKASNAKELIFNTKDGKGLDSSIKCMTAGSSGVGRSDTFNALHLSELAFWEGNVNDTYVGLMQSVPYTSNSMVIVESTANGYNFFKDFWDKANNNDENWNGFYPLFFPWFEEPTYRLPYNGFLLSKEEIDLKVRFNLDNEQIAWRRYAINNLCGGEIEKFHQEYPSTPEEAFISTGRTVFPKDLISIVLSLVRKNQEKKHIRFNYVYLDNRIDEIEVEEDKTEKPIITIFEEPKEFCPYVIGVDTAGEGDDYFVAQVLDNTTAKQVAILRMKDDELYFIQQLYCLGLYYNNALIGIETNLSSYPTKKLEELEYDNQYIRVRDDTIGERITQSYGFRTTSRTKPLILSNYKNMFKETPTFIRDETTLKEMLVFVEEDGKMGALTGYHDDCVMAMAIALHLFTTDQQDHNYSEKNEKRIKQKTFFDDIDYKEEGYLKWD